MYFLRCIKLNSFENRKVINKNINIEVLVYPGSAEEGLKCRLPLSCMNFYFTLDLKIIDCS